MNATHMVQHQGKAMFKERSSEHNTVTLAGYSEGTEVTRIIYPHFTQFKTLSFTLTSLSSKLIREAEFLYVRELPT
jgi:hypothetical protein